MFDQRLCATRSRTSPATSVALALHSVMTTLLIVEQMRRGAVEPHANMIVELHATIACVLCNDGRAIRQSHVDQSAITQTLDKVRGANRVALANRADIDTLGANSKLER